MICIKMLSIGYQITFKIKRNRIRMEKLEKTETLGLGDRKKKMKNHSKSWAMRAKNSIQNGMKSTFATIGDFCRGRVFCGGGKSFQYLDKYLPLKGLLCGNEW